MVDQTKKIKDIEARVKKIEIYLFGSSPKKSPKKADAYKGLSGGLRLLIENNFFKKPKLVTEVQDELKKEGYYYSIQATDVNLRKSLVNRKKILTRIKVSGVWQYVLRR